MREKRIPLLWRYIYRIYVVILDGTPFSYNNIANSGERVQFKNRVYVYDCCCFSSAGVGAGVRAMRSLNHFSTEVIGKHPAEGWCRKCNTLSPPNASATSVSTRANVLNTQGQGLRRRNRAGENGRRHDIKNK
jgi:hypothetical protein